MRHGTIVQKSAKKALEDFETSQSVIDDEQTKELNEIKKTYMKTDDYSINLGVKITEKNGLSKLTILRGTVESLNTVNVYEHYPDDDTVSESVELELVSYKKDEVTIKLDELFSKLYFSEELKEELLNVTNRNNNHLVLKRNNNNSPNHLKGTTYNIVNQEDNYYAELIDSTEINLLDKHYYTPLYNPAYNQSSSGNFVLGTGNTFWSVYSPSKSSNNLSYKNRMIFEHNPYWHHKENDAFGKTIDPNEILGTNGDQNTYDIQPFEIPERDLSLKYQVDIEYLDESFYHYNMGEAWVNLDSLLGNNGVTPFNEYYYEQSEEVSNPVISEILSSLTPIENIVQISNVTNISVLYPNKSQVEQILKELNGKTNIKITIGDTTYVPLELKNNYFRTVIVPEQNVKHKDGTEGPIEYDTKSVRKSDNVTTYYSQEWGKYTFDKLKGKYTLSYTQVSSNGNSAIYTSNNCVEDEREFYSKFTITPDLDFHVTSRSGWYVQGVLEENTWNLDKNTILTKYSENANFDLDIERMCYPFKTTYNPRASTSGNRIGSIPAIPLSFDESWDSVDPRPYNTESGKFSYIDLFKNWNAPAQDEKYDIFEYGVFQQGSNSSVKYNDLKAVTTLDNTYLLKLFLSNSGNPLRLYTGQLLNGGIGYKYDFGNALSILTKDYLDGTTDIPQDNSFDPNYHSFRGFYQNMTTTSFSENALYDTMYYDSSENKLKTVDVVENKVLGTSFANNLENVIGTKPDGSNNFENYGTTAPWSAGKQVINPGVNEFRPQIGKIVEWIEERKLDTEFLQRYPAFEKFVTKFKEYLQEHNLGYYSVSNTNTLNDSDLHNFGPFMPETDLNIPTALSTLICVSQHNTDASGVIYELTTQEKDNIVKMLVNNDLALADTVGRISFINYKDIAANGKSPFIDWYSGQNTDSDTLLHNAIDKMINTNEKLGHSLNSYFDISVKSILRGTDTGALLNNVSDVEVRYVTNQPKTTDYVRSRKCGALRFYADKFRSNQEIYTQFNCSQYYRETGTVPTIGWAEGLSSIHQYTYAPRASQYNSSNEPLPKQFTINGQSQKMIVQHDNDTIIIKTNSVVFENDIPNWDSPTDLAKTQMYRVGLYADSPYKWYVHCSEAIDGGNYVNKSIPEIFGKYGNSSIFYDKLYENKPTGDSSDIKSLVDEGGKTWYYKLSERFWKNSIKSISTNAGKLFFPEGGIIKKYLKYTLPNLILDNDSNLETLDLPDNYAYPSFTKEGEFAGCWPFDTSNLGRNRGTSSGISQSLYSANSGLTVQFYEIQDDINQINALDNETKITLTFTIEKYVKNLKGEDPRLTNVGSFAMYQNTNLPIEPFYNTLSHLGAGYDERQVFLGGFEGSLLYRRKLISEGRFSKDGYFINDCTNNPENMNQYGTTTTEKQYTFTETGINNLNSELYPPFTTENEDIINYLKITYTTSGQVLDNSDLQYFEDSFITNQYSDNFIIKTDTTVLTKFEGPESELCCHLGNSNLANEDGTAKKQYALKVDLIWENLEINIDNPIDPVIDNIIITYESTGVNQEVGPNGTTLNGMPSQTTSVAGIDQSKFDDLKGHYFENESIRGYFVLNNNPMRPYILFTEVQAYDETSESWKHEWEFDGFTSYGEFLRKTPGGVANSPYMCYKFAFLPVPSIGSLTTYYITEAGIGYLRDNPDDNIAPGLKDSALEYLTEKYITNAKPGDIINDLDKGLFLESFFTFEGYASNNNGYFPPCVTKVSSTTYYITEAGIGYLRDNPDDNIAPGLKDSALEYLTEKYITNAKPGDIINDLDKGLFLESFFTFEGYASNNNGYFPPCVTKVSSTTYYITEAGIGYLRDNPDDNIAPGLKDSALEYLTEKYITNAKPGDIINDLDKGLFLESFFTFEGYASNNNGYFPPCVTKVSSTTYYITEAGIGYLRDNPDDNIAPGLKDSALEYLTEKYITNAKPGDIINDLDKGLFLESFFTFEGFASNNNGYFPPCVTKVSSTTYYITEAGIGYLRDNPDDNIAPGLRASALEYLTEKYITNAKPGDIINDLDKGLFLESFFTFEGFASNNNGYFPPCVTKTGVMNNRKLTNNIFSLRDTLDSSLIVTDGFTLTYLVGTWKLYQGEGAIEFGTVDNILSFKTDIEDVNTKKELYNNTFTIREDGEFYQDLGEQTWLYDFQRDENNPIVNGGQPGTPINPIVSKYGTISVDTTGEITLTGIGTFLGIPAVNNTGKVNSVSDLTEVNKYKILSIDENIVTIEIPVTANGVYDYYQVKLQKVTDLEIRQPLLKQVIDNYAVVNQSIDFVMNRRTDVNTVMFEYQNCTELFQFPTMAVYTQNPKMPLQQIFTYNNESPFLIDTENQNFVNLKVQEYLPNHSSQSTTMYKTVGYNDKIESQTLIDYLNTTKEGRELLELSQTPDKVYIVEQVGSNQLLNQSSRFTSMDKFVIKIFNSVTKQIYNLLCSLESRNYVDFDDFEINDPTSISQTYDGKFTISGSITNTEQTAQANYYKASPLNYTESEIFNNNLSTGDLFTGKMEYYSFEFGRKFKNTFLDNFGEITFPTGTYGLLFDGSGSLINDGFYTTIFEGSTGNSRFIEMFNLPLSIDNYNENTTLCAFYTWSNSKRGISFGVSNKENLVVNLTGDTRPFLKIAGYTNKWDDLPSVYQNLFYNRGNLRPGAQTLIDELQKEDGSGKVFVFEQFSSPLFFGGNADDKISACFVKIVDFRGWNGNYSYIPHYITIQVTFNNPSFTFSDITRNQRELLSKQYNISSITPGNIYLTTNNYYQRGYYYPRLEKIDTTDPDETRTQNDLIKEAFVKYTDNPNFLSDIRSGILGDFYNA